MTSADLEREMSKLVALSGTYTIPFRFPGGWAMSEEACRFVGTFVRWARPRRVLEFGSGFSSLVIASELARHGGGKLDSIDNSVRWSTTAREMAREHDLLGWVEFHLFPLGLRIDRSDPYVFYRIQRAFYEGQSPYDLVIVDGPHHDVGRDGALPESFARLRVGGHVIMDDCKSDHMKHTLAKWKMLFGRSIVCIDSIEIGNGVGVIKKLNDSPPDFLALPRSHRIRDWVRTVRNLVRVIRLHLNKD